MSMERFSLKDSLPGADAEGDLEGLSNPFSLYERVAREESGYRAGVANYVREVIMRLQGENRLPSAPMSEKDRALLVESLILALDRGTCEDEEGAKLEWILKGASAIYGAGK